ncbi:uncharacterized protein ARMOST_20107 [Armillaria ostoyae]|uniref:Uncharacterized protein n=1 Tax=Armillaria ostoyae TaxID=47428 RepID=A0A284S6F7_ARMOS|nr:uncharacterized protein ARMOST_20107 [Armillaria ostoyae]
MVGVVEYFESDEVDRLGFTVKDRQEMDLRDMGTMAISVRDERCCSAIND